MAELARDGWISSAIAGRGLRPAADRLRCRRPWAEHPPGGVLDGV